MRIIKLILINLLLVSSLVITANFCLAVDPPAPGAATTPASGFSGGIQETGKLVKYYDVAKTDPVVYVANAVKFLLTFIGIVFLGLIVYAGIIYMTSAGVEEKIKKSTGTMKSASFGILLIVLGYSFINLLLTIIPTPAGTPGSGAFSNVNSTFGTGYQNTQYRAECEDDTSDSYYDLNCCQYRMQVRGTADSVCCGQSLFTAWLPPDNCKAMCGEQNCPTTINQVAIDQAKAACAAAAAAWRADDTLDKTDTCHDASVALPPLPGKCDFKTLTQTPWFDCVWAP